MLKHLKAREDFRSKSLREKGFTLIELLVVIVILGILAAVVIFAVGAVRKRAQLNACKTDTKTIKTAIVAWNTDYLSGDSSYTNPYPDTMSDLTSGAKLIQEDSSLHTISGSGSTIPTIGFNGSKCSDAGENITQLS